jgi:uncharacterized protein YjiS (DUF1127 family)
MSAGIFAALPGALPLAQCFVRSDPPPRPNRPRSTPDGVRERLRNAWRRHRTRQCLVELNAYLLKDIGVSFAEAEAEANKPFWML